MTPLRHVSVQFILRSGSFALRCLDQKQFCRRKQEATTLSAIGTANPVQMYSTIDFRKHRSLADKAKVCRKHFAVYSYLYA